MTVADVKRRTCVGVTTPAPRIPRWDDGVIDNRTESRVYRELVRRHYYYYVLCSQLVSAV